MRWRGCFDDSSFQGVPSMCAVTMQVLNKVAPLVGVKALTTAFSKVAVDALIKMKTWRSSLRVWIVGFS